jgi:hypothetical protein
MSRLANRLRWDFVLAFGVAGMSKDGEYIEEFATGVGATVGGLILTPLAGLAGTIIGAGIGGSATLIIVKNLDYLTDLPKRLQTEFEIKRLIRGKLNADFDDSYLSKTELAIWSLKDARAIINGEDERFAWVEDPIVPEAALSDETVQQNLKLLRKVKNIKASCTAISAAAVAVLKSLQQRYCDEETYGEYALKLELDFSSINAREQVNKVVRDTSFDFIVTSNDAFYFAESEKTSLYKLLLCCHGASQYLFLRKGLKYIRRNRVHVYPESTAALHFKNSTGISSMSEEEPLTEVRTIPKLIENIAGGDGILAWDPLSNILFKQKDKYHVVEGSRHHIYYGLRCHKRWTNRRMDRARKAFKALFINEWNSCNQRRTGAYKLLIADPQYRDRFAEGAGIKVPAPFQ